MNDSSIRKATVDPHARWSWWVAGGLALSTAAATTALSRASDARPAELSGFERRCTGSFLVLEETSLAQTIWTFHADHTLVSTSSGELLFAFGNQQGSWRPEGVAGARAVQLDFDWDVDGNLEAIGRVDIDVSADDRSCDTISGFFEGRLFAAGEDPLELGDTPPLFGDTVTGRRIRVP